MAGIKQAVKDMCKFLPGGREAMAGALGMSIATFNNNLYEKSGCRFFELHELEAMEDLSGSSILADYFARRRGALLVDIPKFEDLDQVELFTKSVQTAAMRGRVDQIIQQALDDDVIDQQEAEEIDHYHRRHLAARDEEVKAITAVFGRKRKKP